MEIVCSQSELKNNLSQVSRVVPSRPTHPILGNVLLVANQETQRISLTGFDLSLGIRTSFNAEVNLGGSITLPAKLLNDIVSRLPEGEISLICDGEEIDGEETTVSLTSASGKFQIRGMNAEEFPELPVIEDEVAFMLPVEILSEGIKGALFAASTDETKQVLTGVRLTGDRDTIEFAATDGHRLAVVQTQLENSPEEDKGGEFSVTIPAKALRELEKMLTGEEANGLIELHFDDTQVVFELSDRRLTTRKLEGIYPEYQKLIPTEFATTASVDRKRLLSGLELVAVLADEKNLVKFTIDGSQEQLFLSVKSQDIGSAKESMPAQITGEDIEVAFNVKYLMDGLKALPTTDIQMQLNARTQPVIFTPLGGVKMTYLVMPLQIRD
ncbi:MAG: DNA polymerase III subunit beta [Prochloraceae cyanobacterium]|nr:DNA polymerase III subunit beta [Prochloraceae cyanobacterium]